MPAGWRLKTYESLDSTNAALRRIVEIEGDVREGLTVLAKTQTTGRGRMGRAWESPSGNVYVSILIEAPKDQSIAPQIGFVTAVAVVKAILDLPRHNAPPPPLSHKWPNDVLADGKKVCGILPEMVSDMDGKSWIIVGLGINLRPVIVEGAMYPVGALEAHNIDTTPEHVLTVFCRNFVSFLEMWRTSGFAPIREEWMTKAPELGSPVSVGTPHGSVQGTFSGLDEHGALLLDSSEGPKQILAGDVLLGIGDT